MRQGLAARRAVGAELGRPLWLALLAGALAVVNNSGERHWEAELHRLKGALLLHVEGGVRKAALTTEA